MSITLSGAPRNVMLSLISVDDDQLRLRLERIGVTSGTQITLMEEEARMQPVRIKGKKGEAVLSAGMAAKVVVHHDDDHKTPVFEMRPGEKGHIEGLTAGSSLERTLAILGFAEGDSLELVRCLPPMDYVTLIDGKRIRLVEGMASKIFGTVDGNSTQFVLVGRGKSFMVTDILGGRKAAATIANVGIAVGVEIMLERVEQAQSAPTRCCSNFLVQTAEGLRFFLKKDQADSVVVTSA